MLLLPALIRSRVFLFVTLVALTLTSFGQANRRRQPAQPRTDPQQTPIPAGGTTVILENGLVVSLVPIANCNRVAVETLYKAGFLYEPAGMTQVSHLVEHLVVNGKIPGYAEGEANRAMSALGMANAETLPHFTHFDYVAPSSSLEAILKVEASRIRNLEITPELIKKEAQRCYQEVDFVEKDPATGMVKHGMMALNQAWRKQSSAKVRSGLEDLDIEAVKDFHRTHYAPNRMVIVIAGGFDPANALELVKTHFGSLPRGTGYPSIVDWISTPAEGLLQWDGKIRVFCLAYSPPVEAKDRLLATLLGNSLLPKMQRDPNLKLMADFVFTPNTSWQVDPLPFFIYAAPKTNLSLLKMQQTIVEGLETPGSKRPNGPDIQQFKIALAELISRPTFTMELINQHATQLGQQTNQDTSKAVDTVIANIALRAGMRELALEGLTSRDLAEIARMTAEELEWAFNRITDASKQRLTVLTPAVK